MSTSPQELSAVDQLHQQESSFPFTESRPSSPSCYMRRLPPPSGFYLSKEHSYAQLCPLLWRRHYDQAINCLEKALRQLHAARRRENRLRSTVLKLREKLLSSSLLMSRDSSENQESWTSGCYRSQCKGCSNLEESETEDTGLYEDRCVDQVELGDPFLDSSSWCEEEGGYCLCCGRSQMQVGDQEKCTPSKTRKYFQPTKHKEKMKIQRSAISTYIADNDDSNIQIVRQRSTTGCSVETSRLHHEVPAGLCLSNTQEQSLQFLASEQKLLPSGTTVHDAGTQEDHIDLQQQQFWIQNTADGQIILVPVSAGFLRTEEVTKETQTIWVPYVHDKGEVGHMIEYNGGVARAETACDEEHSDYGSVTPVERKEDLREKLKEHLEGFHLELSTEFIN